MAEASASRPFYIGCSTDRNFVEPTAVMLSSVDVNGAVEEEVAVIVAAFGLDERDRQRIRVGAGRLADRLRFFDVDPEMLQDVDLLSLTSQYPPAVLGRLLIADQIPDATGRLLTLDSDMIVNTSLRPLFELDLGPEYFAAIHDPPRDQDPNYFNSGLTLCNVETYRFHDVGRRCLRFIAEHRPHFPDQDALNYVVGNCWYRLAPLWNYFYSGSRDFRIEDYEAAKVAHFCGGKPWNHADHGGAQLYNRHLAIYRAKLDQAAAPTGAAARLCIANAYEVLLGRELESSGVVADRGQWPRSEILRSIVHSSEFLDNVLPALSDGRWPQGRFPSPPGLSQRLWAAGHLPLGSETAAKLEALTTWTDVLQAILSDPTFRSTVGFDAELAAAA